MIKIPGAGHARQTEGDAITVQRTRILAFAGLLVAAGPTLAALSDEAAFLAENQTAMDRMMAGMAAQPSGDDDRDFVAGMIPHHQGAVDMAHAELRFGTNEQLRRIAHKIVIEQQQEIAAMRLALSDPPPSANAAPHQVQGHSTMNMK